MLVLAIMRRVLIIIPVIALVGALPLKIDLEWVLQGSQFGFQGFFVEYLGFSSAMKDLLPQSRITQSTFMKSFEDFPVKNPDTFFGRELFPLESNNLLELMNKDHTSMPVGEYLELKSLYAPSIVPDSCSSRSNFEENYVFIGNNIAKFRVSDASNDVECCEACVAEPLCNAWTYDSLGCSLKGGAGMYSGHEEQGATSGRLINRADKQVRTPLPKVIVFHGTMCILYNQTITRLKRDINTIFIGRYMVERSKFVRGQSIDEYAISQCTPLMDEVWVPTEWHKIVFENIMRDMNVRAPMVSVVPEAVDTTLFDPELAIPLHHESHHLGSDSIYGDSNMAIKEQKECLFVEGVVTCSTGVFEFSSIFKWEQRKGWDVLLNAYWSAFTVQDNVVLRIRSYMPSFLRGDSNITANIEAHAQQALGKPLHELAKVVWESGPLPEKLSDSLSRADMRDLLASVDAFVLPTRGEGWGLPIAEAMAMALPVIVTNYSGPTAYANENNSYLLSVLPELDSFAYAQPDTEHLSKLMKQVVYESSVDGGYRAHLVGKEARKTMQLISPHSIVETMIKRIEYHVNRRGFEFVKHE